MAHPYSAHREQKVSRDRVGHIMKSGGTPKHSDAAADKKLFANLMAKHEAGESKVAGAKHGGRYARGGRTKHKPAHQVNIAIVNPHHPTDAGAAPGGPMMPPPRPPAMAGAPGLPPGLPPGGPPMGGPPGGLPPGMKPPGMMKRGGKVKGYARGGKLGFTAGSFSGVGRLEKKKIYGKNARKG